MGKRRIDLTGRTFGRLTVIQFAGTNKRGSYMWLCECECGNTKVVDGADLRRGGTKSCGCLAAENTSRRTYVHGMTGTKIHNEWLRMKTRCREETPYGPSQYSKRGITVCEKWANDFQSFYDDVSVLDNFGEPGYSLDRIDNDGDYEPGNVRWATPLMQANNRGNNIWLTYNGETYTQAEWARKLGINYGTLQGRLRSGWPVDKALSTK